MWGSHKQTLDARFPQANLPGSRIAASQGRGNGVRMTSEAIREGFEVFLADGEHPVGAVRRVYGNPPSELVIYFENTGDRTVPLAAVTEIHSKKIMLDASKLDASTREAIRHAHDAEDR
jgi:hypothetical protein